MVLEEGRCVYLSPKMGLVGNKQEDRVIGASCSALVKVEGEDRMGALFREPTLPGC